MFTGSFIAGCVFGFAVIVVAVHAVTFSIFGWFVSNKKLDEIIPDLNEYNRLCGREDNIILTSSASKPYLATIRLPFVIMTKWYIDDVGIVSRWSKWSSMLDERRNELLAGKTKKEDEGV